MKKKSTSNLESNNKYYDKNIIDMLENTDKCLYCGIPFKYLNNKDQRRNRGYCSREHYLEYPPKMAYISKVYGKTAKESIIEILNTCKTKKAAAELLGIREFMLLKYIKKLNIKKIVQYKWGAIMCKQEKWYLWNLWNKLLNLIRAEKNVPLVSESQNPYE